MRGYRPEAVEGAGARFVDNPNFATTGEAYSLALAEDALAPGTLVAFGDIVVKRHIVQALLEEATSGITIAVDSTLAGTEEADRVIGGRADTDRFSLADVTLTAIGPAVAARESHGVWIGLLHAGNDGVEWLKTAIAAARADGSLARSSLADLLTRVREAGHAIRVVYHRGGWANVNDIGDLVDASGL